MSNHLIAIGFAVLSMLSFSLTYAFYKASLPFMPNTLAIFFQSLFSWGMILPFALRKGADPLVSHRLGMIVVRTIFGLLSLYCISRALTKASLAEVILLNNAFPLYVPFIASLWMREKINHRLWPSLILGFIGVLVVIRPGFMEFNSGLAFALFSGLFSASLLVVTRQIAHEPFIRIMFYYFLLFGLILSPFLFSDWSSPPLHVWLLLACAAATMISAQLSFTAAARFAPPQQIAPFIYTGVIFSGLIDWIVWKQTPGFVALIGMAIVCTGGILTLIRRT